MLGLSRYNVGLVNQHYTIFAAHDAIPEKKGPLTEHECFLTCALLKSFVHHTNILKLRLSVCHLIAFSIGVTIENKI